MFCRFCSQSCWCCWGSQWGATEPQYQCFVQTKSSGKCSTVQERQLIDKDYMPQGFRAKRQRQRVREVQDARNGKKTSLDVTFLKQDGKGSWHQVWMWFIASLCNENCHYPPKPNYFHSSFPDKCVWANRQTWTGAWVTCSGSCQVHRLESVTSWVCISCPCLRGWIWNIWDEQPLTTTVKTGVKVIASDLF